MNDTLLLRGSFETKSASNPGAPTLPTGATVSSEHIQKLYDNLLDVLDFWKKQQLSINPILCARYCRVVAKSNRIRRLLSQGSYDASEFIVGAKFDHSNGEHSPKHVITYCVSLDVLNSSLQILKMCKKILLKNYNGSINKKQLDKAVQSSSKWSHKQIKKTVFAQVIRDAFYVEEFYVSKDVDSIDNETFVTLYQTGVDTATILRQLGLNVEKERIINEIVRLFPEEYETLRKDAPFLISMSVVDMLQYGPTDGEEEHVRKDKKSGEEPQQESQGDNRIASYNFPKIPSPTDEPIIGVIDTVFNSDAYFSEWVETVNYVDTDIPDQKGIEHGTEVASIIVDGPALNSGLQDGCGRFRVKHFGVSKGGIISSFTLMRNIQKIVSSNSYIKVWNLSLGTPKECPRYAISPISAMLDELQHELDIIFIVAGTNGENVPGELRVGAPADSINSIVVNSVEKNGNPATYSRRGPVLEFFHKPDIAYYGGTQDEPLIAAAPFATMYVKGTSFAAPWITRKIAFLIYKAHCSKEEAKAILIDSAFGWGEKSLSLTRGYGVPPVNIRDIVETPNNEIRFVISGTVNAYETYNHKIPVPLHDKKYPYIARATLCYFPECKRSQGVDYTSTELDLHFGRLKKGGLASLDKNIQGEEGKMLYEADARGAYRKWDNIKHISDVVKSRFSARKVFDVPSWGITIRKKERSNLNDRTGAGLTFSVVVTLKEMFNKNRIDDFIYQCSFNCGWIVNRINMNIINQIHEAARAEIEFDD